MTISVYKASKRAVRRSRRAARATQQQTLSTFRAASEPSFLRLCAQ